MPFYRICPNCLYCREYHDNDYDDSKYRVFCRLNGSWLVWPKDVPCIGFLSAAGDDE